MSDNHGNTPAAWTAVAVAMVGFLVGGVGLMLDPVSMTAVLGRLRARRRPPLVVFAVMAKMGLQQLRPLISTGTPPMSVLDDIVAGVRIDLDRRRSATPRWPTCAPRSPTSTRRATRCPHFRGRRVQRDRRGQAAQPEQGRPRRHPRPGRAGRGRTPPAAPPRSACSPRSAGSAAASTTCARSARRSTSRCCARTSSSSAYQLLEARAAGADLALLIVAALDDDTLRRLHDEARELGLTVLVEVHDEAETERAVALGAELVGVNARNLKTLDVDPDDLRPAGAAGPRRPGAGRRVRHHAVPTTSTRYVAEGAASCSSARRWSRTATPRRAVRDDDGSDAR